MHPANAILCWIWVACWLQLLQPTPLVIVTAVLVVITFLVEPARRGVIPLGGLRISRRLARYGDRNWRVVTALLSCLSPGQAAAALHGDPDGGWWLGLALTTPRLALAAASALRAQPD